MGTRNGGRGETGRRDTRPVLVQRGSKVCGNAFQLASYRRTRRRQTGPNMDILPSDPHKALSLRNEVIFGRIQMEEIYEIADEPLGEQVDDQEEVASNEAEPVLDRSYTHWEELKTLEYIKESCSYHKLKGVAFWKKMEAKNIVPERTWQSLKEHFRRQIMPKLNKFPAHLTKEFNL
ncbi:uncharacterized protein LOC123510107 isoform X2 [Portunus trituberculatus]|uniref:uncharacterized protein LOC123510107 isoform X2 n=1 Tax=Portunus trituberculatus TaxID=210409 RepID=UPI001E1CCC9A|nr:uncharacterized protein LOC123510107 isoform X2 [Portunus trituberculatus]